jgi:oxygen-independent coproporphyrinogen-3 oxidase
LALRRFAPVGARRGVLLVTHAMMASGAYLGRFAEHASGRGFDTFVLDFRGHGASKPPHAGPSDWSFDDYVRHDLPAAIAAVTAETSITPRELTYIGHSLGGLAGVATFATGKSPAPGRLVLVAVNTWTRDAMQPLRRAAASLFGASARVAGRVPAKTLGVGTEDEPAGYARQFLAWTRGAWTDRSGNDYGSFIPRLQMPILSVCGLGDWLCRPADARRFIAPAGGPLRLRLVGRAAGDAFDPDHFALMTDRRLGNLWSEMLEAR